MSNKVIPPLRKGDLTQFGYKLSNNAQSRHIALGKAIKKYGKLSVFRKVNALVVLFKNKPHYESKLKADRNWIDKHI